MEHLSNVRLCTSYRGMLCTITHSVCTLEFEVHRPLYNWVLEDWEDTEKPRQIEFARLNVTKWLCLNANYVLL